MEKGLKEVLDNLGFSIGNICEAILTTYGPQKIPNAAPMGVMRTAPVTLEIKPFKNSTSYKNLLSDKVACLNVTDDPSLFLVTAFKESNFKGLPNAIIDNKLRLFKSDASIFLTVVDSKDVSENRSSFSCYVTGVELHRTIPRAFSRGRAEAIEAIIHATRIQAFSEEGKRPRVERLIKRFKECKGVVNKVSPPESVEAKVVEELERLIDKWGKKE